MRILVVDDTDELLDLIQTVLETVGWTVHLASSAKEGLLMAPQGYDILLLDRNLPDMAESDFLPRVTAACPKARVIQMTGTSGTKPAEGVEGLLQKPFDPLGLSETLLSLLGDQRG